MFYFLLLFFVDAVVNAVSVSVSMRYYMRIEFYSGTCNGMGQYTLFEYFFCALLLLAFTQSKHIKAPYKNMFCTYFSFLRFTTADAAA